MSNLIESSRYYKIKNKPDTGHHSNPIAIYAEFQGIVKPASIDKLVDKSKKVLK